MRHSLLSSVVVWAIATVGLGGCALLPARAHWAKTQPAAVPTDAIDIEDGLYRSAKLAIQRRDYATAIEQLQAARARQPDDIRVLNAFGVVYDKLGRFDLSARYYAQAAALDASSEIVLGNLEYSHLLQGLAGAEAARPIVLASSKIVAPVAPAPPAQPQEGPRLVAVAQNVLRLEVRAPAEQSVAERDAWPSKLMIVDSTGRDDGAEDVRIRLASRGWTVPRQRPAPTAAIARTTIRYAAGDQATATALANTLGGPARLINCGQTCKGLTLAVGSDALLWPRSTGD